MIVWLRQTEGRTDATRSCGSALVLVASFALILPFVLNFDPESRGIGAVSTPPAVRASASATWR